MLKIDGDEIEARISELEARKAALSRFQYQRFLITSGKYTRRVSPNIPKSEK
jgi:hypothetical protein